MRGAKDPNRTHTVYRFYAEDGTLLYVGRTSLGVNRIKTHSASSDWWPEVASIGVEHFEDEEDAAERERVIISVQTAKYNRQLRPLPAPPVIPEVAA